MLRPATPLTILLLISFVLLLLSTLSSPIIPSIPLSSFKGVNFGVFGYCTPDDGCIPMRVGYTIDGLFPNDSPGFNLPSESRRTLSGLLVVHPVAGFLNLIALALAAAAHFHSPSHSARYLLGLLILLLPTLLVTLLAFLIDILLFVPHLKWGGWIVLASTILITAAGVVTCAMRRTLVSRKARKKRIAENAEMSGENFYNRQAQEKPLPTTATFSTTETKGPPANGLPDTETLPSFVTFDSNRRTDEDRLPLNENAPSIGRSVSRDDASARYYGGPPSRTNSAPRDQYGNPMASRSGPGAIPPLTNRSPDNRRGPGPGAGPGAGPPPGPVPYRDGMTPPRGGYGPRGRGGYAPRGGYPPRGGFGSRGPPPQGYNGRGGYPGRGRGGYPPPGPSGPGVDGAGAMMAGAAVGGMAARGMGPPPPGYGPGPTPENDGQAYAPPGRQAVMSPSIYSAAPGEGFEPYGHRAQSPGSQRRPSMGSRGPSPANGMRATSPAPDMPPMPVHAGGQGPPPEDFVPARSGWVSPGPPPQHMRGPPPGAYCQAQAPPGRSRVNSGGSDIYYEDVDPRFASDPEILPPAPHMQGRLPPSLAAGQRDVYHNESPDSLQIQPPPLTNSYEELPGARSPAESETSNFTSVSQRGINPNWRPGYGEGQFSSLGPMRRPSRDQRQDVLLDGNPDFQLPGMPPTGRRPPRGRGGYGPGYGPPGRMAAPMLPPVADGPYPRGPPMIPGDGVREI